MTAVDGSLRTLIRFALQEDLGRSGDAATRLLIPKNTRVLGVIVARETGVVCGLDAARLVFKTVSPRIRWTQAVRDGAPVRPGRIVARLRGPREILTAERVALNFLQHLSGVATLAHAYADKIRGTGCRIFDTRKTLPGWRRLEKYAVRCGGGFNHRMGLYDAVMIKDNHLACLPAAGKRGAEALARRLGAIRRRRGLPVILEAKTRAEVDWAIECRPDVILLDNMPVAGLRREIRYIRKHSRKIEIEASGGVNLSNVRAIARCGPDRISIGRITHSAPAIDFSLEIIARPDR